MAEFISQPSELPMNSPNTDQRFKNVKELKSGDGSFRLTTGKLELRDSDGNIVILMDANG